MEKEKSTDQPGARAGGSSAGRPMRTRVLVATAVLAAAATLIWSRLPAPQARAEAERYIRWHHTITLTPEQEAIKEEALRTIPAPCCSSFSIATCCCPCNLAKAAWGLAAYDVATRGYGVAEVRQDVERWLASINPHGAAGDACQRGRCPLPFQQDGCGGMDEGHVS